MLLSFLWSAQASDVFVLCWPLLSLLGFQKLTHAVEDAVRFLVFASLDVTLVADVVVEVVNVILLAADENLFPHSPALTRPAALAVVASFFS